MDTEPTTVMSCAYLLWLKKFLGLSCGIFIAILVFQEYFTFWYIKPTSTSEEKQNMKSSNFPEILVCQTPGYDIESLKSYGYPSSFWFAIEKQM